VVKPTALFTAATPQWRVENKKARINAPF